MSRIKWSAIWPALVVSSLLVACGGSSSSSGGGSPANPSTPETPEPPASERVSTWLNVVPPGANGNTAGGGTQGQQRPDNMTDQLHLYEELAFAPEGLKSADENGECAAPNNETEHAAADRSLACSHFKPAFLKPTEVTSTYTVVNPNTGNTVTIKRDGWGVPFVTAPTREDGMFGVGFVGAQDRLFLHDVLRKVGRGRLTEFLGPEESFFAQDLSVLNDAGYSESEMSQIIDSTKAKFGELGVLVGNDLDNLVDGINEYLHQIGVPRSADERHPDDGPADGNLSEEMPLEYGTLVTQTQPELWVNNDVVASAVLIQSTFAFGGGGETKNLQTLLALDPALSDSNRTPSKQACEYWRDIRHAADPDTPQTDPINAVGAAQSPAVLPEDCEAAYPAGNANLPAGAAIWDVNSFRSRVIIDREQNPFPPAPGGLGARSHEPEMQQLHADVESENPVASSLERVLARVDRASKTLHEELEALAGAESEQDYEQKKHAAVQKSIKLLAQADPDAEIMSANSALFGRKSMSNFIGVNASETESGYPLVVAGPQAAYFLAQLLWEVAVVTEDAGPGQLGLTGRGVVFANLPYINIGRGVDFSWSATSGNSDLVDTRVSKACLLPGGALSQTIAVPSQFDNYNNSTGANGADGFPDFDGYLFDHDISDGFDPECRPVYFRTDQWRAPVTPASLASGGQPVDEDVTFYAMRTHYGTVIGTATLGPDVLVVSKQRSTFFASLDTAPPFALVNTYLVDGAESFFDLFNATTGTFNWLYSDKNDLAWFHSGLYPKRHPEHHPDLPVWGDGRFEWEGAKLDLSERPDFFSSVTDGDGDGNSDAPYPSLITISAQGSELDGFFEFDGFLTRNEHPRVINPEGGFLHSWNNNPAKGWWAADFKTDYGPTHRADMLKDRMEAYKATGKKHNLASMVEIMADAAHTDLRGLRIIPKVLDILATTDESEIQGLGLTHVTDLAALTQVTDLLDDWAKDGSMDWIDPSNAERGLGGYRRTQRAADGSPTDAALAGAARNDEPNNVGFEYGKRSAVVFSDVLYPQLLLRTLDQIVGRNNGRSSTGDRVSVQGTHDDMAQGSAFQEGWYEFLERIYGQALDVELGLDGTADEYQKGEYKVLRCGASFGSFGAGSSFEHCRQQILKAVDDALICLGGLSDIASWDGTTTASYSEANLGDCLTGQDVVEVQDQTTHTAISAQTVEPMHWTNRPTYQHAVEIQHDRDERLENDIP